jgi:general secretion pathway protein M
MEPLPQGARGRALALAILAVALGAIWACVMVPLRDWYDARADTLAERRTMLAHMEHLAEALPALRQRAEHAAHGPQAAALLDGDSDAIAGAGLQGMMQEMASAAGATLASAEVLPGEQRGNYRRIALRITLTADWTTVVSLLRAIASNPVPLLIDDLQMHAVAQVGPSVPVAATTQIDTSLVVMGFRASREPGAASPVPIGQQAGTGPPDTVALTMRGQSIDADGH